MLKSKQRGVRGKNRLANALNKPIEGRLAEKPTNLFKVILFALTLTAILAYSVSELGVENGFKITMVLIVIFFLAYLQGKSRSK
ncbi:hypothetical protein HF888_09120 [Bermanella marisrubri]|uniref:Uncharacterized protein n=1 Tax=Bermanella marisrubri TaxID=207949 RepID=Q1N6K0_9GAMM|nr:hypothetical protein [Bermanella marisrubri]EAT13592.1 hypothetical protein RED65_09379 [Oceanobacter sp. RED65] [Bermanella marisrubri]QIZ84380.1 hypothetical protein HF888_09120 [Bermanella marisrubri]